MRRLLRSRDNPHQPPVQSFEFTLVRAMAKFSGIPAMRENFK